MKILLVEKSPYFYQFLYKPISLGSVVNDAKWCASYGSLKAKRDMFESFKRLN